MDASLMNGTNFKCGAVCCLQNFKNPITIAEMVMERTEHVLLAGEGAKEFALSQGARQVEIETLLTEREIEFLRSIIHNEQFTGKTVFENEEKRGTVGCVVLDCHGNICAGTSTGGIPKKLPGRTGDSPLIGSGTYADSAFAGVSTTGWGESIMKVQLASLAVRYLEFGMETNCQKAAERAIVYLEQKVQEGLGGLIMLDKQGNYGVAFNTKRIAYGYVERGEIVVRVDGLDTIK